MRITRSQQATLLSFHLSILLLPSSCISSIPHLVGYPLLSDTFVQVCDGVSVRGDVHHGRDNCDGNGYVESSQIDLISSLTLPRFSPGGAGKHTWMSKMYIYISPYIMYMLVWIHKCMNISIYMIIYFLLGSRSPSRRSLSSSSPITHPSLSGEK